MQTAAFVAAVVLDPAFGLAQGFELYDAAATTAVGAHRIADVAARKWSPRCAWLDQRDRERAFFIWLHVRRARYLPPEG